MAKRRSRRTFEARLAVVKADLARNRDELRELLEEGTAVLESCDQAMEELETAVETLSQYL